MMANKPIPKEAEYQITQTALYELKTRIDAGEIEQELIEAVCNDLKTKTPAQIERSYRIAYPRSIGKTALIRLIAELYAPKVQA